MIPHYEVNIWRQLPNAELWTPPNDYWDDNSTIGPYHETWPLVNVDRAHALDMLEREMAAMRIVDEAADEIGAFERMAGAVESGWFDDQPDSVSASDWEALSGVMPEVPAFDGLELGVAGFVTALGSLDCIPAGSCRGHPDPCNWENYPLVVFVCDLERARLIADVAEPNSCGLAVEDAQGVIKLWAPSVSNVHGLARDLLAGADRFDALEPAAYVPRFP